MNLSGFDIGCGAEIETPQGKCPFFLDEKMIERAQWKDLFGVEVPIMSVEDNVVLKAILQRGEDKGKHNIEDIQDMIKGERLDLDYLMNRIQLCHAMERAKPVLQPLIQNVF